MENLSHALCDGWKRRLLSLSAKQEKDGIIFSRTPQPITADKTFMMLRSSAMKGDHSCRHPDNSMLLKSIPG